MPDASHLHMNIYKIIQLTRNFPTERLNKSEAAQSQWPSMDEPEKTESPSVETEAVSETNEQIKEKEVEEETPEVLVQI